MGAVAGEPHSLVERGKAKAENRKKDGCLVFYDPALLGYNAGPCLLVDSGRTRAEVTTVCGRSSMMCLIWKREK